MSRGAYSGAKISFCFHGGKPIAVGFKFIVTALDEPRMMFGYGCKAIDETAVSSKIKSYCNHRGVKSTDLGQLVPAVLCRHQIYDNGIQRLSWQTRAARQG